MSKNPTDKLCQHLLNTASNRAAGPSTVLFGEATIPERMKKNSKDKQKS